MKDNRVQITEYRAKSRAVVLSTPSATRSVARPSSKRDNYIAFLINFVDFRLRSLQKLKRAWFSLACSKILPRRRGSGSDKVDDEGVETSGKAESRKKKAEIAKRKMSERHVS
ncbi:MAG: hypothetical protein IJB60_08785 [Bacteroidaceae bacterium]|nr:hypothetical protein [Bacteroidaceae bacterium]